MNHRFSFEGKQRTVLLGGIVLGIICMIVTLFEGDHGARFWSNFLHNSVFFTGISFISLFVMAAFITAYAGWYVVIKRVWESFSLFLIVGLVFMLIIGVANFMGLHHLYHWNFPGIGDPDNAEMYDSIIAGKKAFLNGSMYLFLTTAIVGVWYFFALKIRSLSLEEDANPSADFGTHKKTRVYAAMFMPIAGFTSSIIVWQWVMSIDAHWYSTMFAWYAIASWFVSACALTILLLIYLKSKGYYQNVTGEHIHDLGKLLFGFSIFWTYLWFSQYMLIWYSNVGEETVYFKTRIREYPILFYGNLIMNFVLPFLVLMRNETKRKFGSVGFIAALVLFGHWFDFFNMIKPGVLHTYHEAAEKGLIDHGHHAEGGHEAAGHGAEAGHAAAGHAVEFVAGFTIPGLLEIGTFIGFLSLFLFFVFNVLSKAELEPANDPYYGESLHHHV